jgi:phosphinothricin acetyltransferase
MLYAELEKRLMDMGIVNLLAGTAYCENEDEYLTHGSYDFHAARGFHQVARLETVGKKFGRWYDLVWMQKKIGEG